MSWLSSTSPTPGWRPGCSGSGWRRSGGSGTADQPGRDDEAALVAALHPPLPAGAGAAEVRVGFRGEIEIGPLPEREERFLPRRARSVRAGSMVRWYRFADVPN